MCTNGSIFYIMKILFPCSFLWFIKGTHTFFEKKKNVSFTIIVYTEEMTLL